jgi:membrane associated rhomboid family serine protease
MTPWVTRIIAANALMFLLTSASPEVEAALRFVPAEAFFRPWTAVTYMFLHANLSHILFNMLALFFFGPRLEAELGDRRFVLLYLISGLAGAAFSFIFSFNAAVIGASAAVYGVFIGFTWFWPKAQIYIWGILPVQARVMVAVMTLMSFFGIFGGGGGDGIAHFAHLGGFVGGYVYLRFAAPGHHAGPQAPQKAAVPVIDQAAVLRWRGIRHDSLHEVNREEYVRIIAKLDKDGPSALTPQEVAFLDRFSARQDA